MLDNMFIWKSLCKQVKYTFDYVKGFEYYSIENESFTNILN
jgi:hypothetical protein